MLKNGQMDLLFLNSLSQLHHDELAVSAASAQRDGWSVLQWPLNMGAAYPCRFQCTLAVDVLAAYTFFGNMCQVWYVVYCMPLPGHSRLCLARHQHISCS